MNDLTECYELIKDIVKLEDWKNYSKNFPRDFSQIPDEWPLNAALRHQLLFAIQWKIFNPDRYSNTNEKAEVTRFFLKHFLGSRFFLRWKSLLKRMDKASSEKWLLSFCTMEHLLEAFKQPQEDRIAWLMHFDTEQKFGKSHRVNVIKTKSLGLVSELLGVDKTMDWPKIKTQYRNALKASHPDQAVGNAPIGEVHSIVGEYRRLQREKEENHGSFF